MKITSLQYDLKNRALSDIFNIKGKIESINIISAYIDIKSLDELISYVKTNIYARGKSELKIFIDESSSRFYSDKGTKQNLLRIQAEIDNTFSKKSGVFLVKFGKLFHSKLYLIEGRKDQGGKVIIGSLNLTQKGLNENEEIILTNDFVVGRKCIANKIANSAREYVEILTEKSTRVNGDVKQGRYPSCMRELLLGGKIYYELKEQNPFRFKLSLPDYVKKQDSIDKMLESVVNDTISLEALIEIGLNKKTLVVNKSKISWKKFCILTCYGYWSPKYLSRELAAELKKKIDFRQPYYDELIRIIKTERDDIEKSFMDFCERIRPLLRNVEDWRYGDPKLARQQWVEWYKKLIEKINNQKFLDRVISDMVTVPVPDVWNDELSALEFEESFFENLKYNWSKEFSKETTNLVAQSIALDLNYQKTDKLDPDIVKLKGDMANFMSEKQGLNRFKNSDEE